MDGDQLAKIPGEVNTTENFLLLQWGEQLKVFNKNLALIQRSPDKKNIHDFRVAFKKLKCFVQLSTEFGSSDCSSCFDEIKKLFAVAGKFRDLQMSLELIKEATEKTKAPMTLFEKTMRSLLIQAKKWTIEQAKGFDDKAINKSTECMSSSIGKMSEKELTAGIKKIANHAIKKIKSLLQDLSDEAHEVRKWLKKLFYWLEVCPVNPVLNQKKMKTLHKILDHLGDWHDHSVMEKRTREFRKAYLAKGTKEYEDGLIVEKSVAGEKSKFLRKAKVQLSFLF
jgi:CHAD domain-containing protein